MFATTTPFSTTMMRSEMLRRGALACRRSFSSGTPTVALDQLTKNPLSLPRLPIPTLDDTIERYLATVRPLTTPDEFTSHESLVRDFQQTTGKILHDKRDAADAASGDYPFSYIERDWDDMYLGGRWSIPINSNPFYILNPAPETHAHLNAQIPRAAAFVTASLNFWRKVRTGQLEPDKGDMSQYVYQFGAGRVARTGRDEVVIDQDSSHIIVISNGHYYKVLAEDGKLQVSTAGVERQLELIQQESLQGEAGACVGVLTTTERDVWGSTRLAMERSTVNVVSVRDLDTSLLVLHLDGGKRSGSSLQSVSELMLHETGVSAGRWYDKHSVVVLEDGTLGINFEHAFSDGMTWNRWLVEAWSDMHGTKSPFAPVPKAACEVDDLGFARLEWELSEGLSAQIEQAKKDFATTVADLDTHVLEFDHFGKNELKSWKMSPDCVVQVGLQLAFARLHGTAPPTYESCSTRGFLRGRTETIRSCTSDAAAFTAAMMSDSADKATRKALFETAVSTQLNVAKAAVAGMGVDRHLKALASVAAQCGKEHALFEDGVFCNSSAFRISSSNVTMPFYDLFGFGPVVGDGYGVGYLILGDKLPANITCFKSSGMSASDMADSMTKSFLDLKELQE